MADAFTGEISMIAGPTAPEHWAFCDGQLLSITGNEALYALLGTIYGGDGQSNFALPDLRGRTPIGAGQGNGLTNRTIGESLGTELETLTVEQLPAHNHPLSASTAPGTSNAISNTSFLGDTTSSGISAYTTAAPSQAMSADTTDFQGNYQGHQNMMPFLTLNFIICLQGIFPPHA